MGVRLAGGLLMVIAGALAGNAKAVRYQYRLEDLRGLLTAIALVRVHVSNGSLPLGKAMEYCGSTVAGRVGFLLSRIGSSIEQCGGDPLSVIWQEHKEIARRSTALTDDDLSVLDRVFSVIGVGPAEYEVRHLNLAEQLLLAQERDAFAKLSTYPRLWRYLGTIGGAVCAILLA